MANTTTTVPMNDTRQVVIEPEKPAQVRLKQYVVLQEVIVDKKTYQKGAPLQITEDVAHPYVAANQIVPLDVAIRNGLYPISKESTAEKIVQAVTGENIPDTPAEIAQAQATSKSGKKSFLGNALRDAIIKKKAETPTTTLPPTKIDADKLAAIKAGGKK